MMNSIAATLKSLGRRAEARSRLEEAIVLHQDAGQPLLEGHALALLGDLDCELGDTVRALERYGNSLRLRREVGDREGEGWMLHRLARVNVERGTPDPARDLLGQAERIAAELEAEKLSTACEQLRRVLGR